MFSGKLSLEASSLNCGLCPIRSINSICLFIYLSIYLSYTRSVQWLVFDVYSQARSSVPTPRFYQWVDYLKNESVSHNNCQIQTDISAWVMSRKYFTRASLYLVRLKIFELIKFLRRHLHQNQGNWAGENFVISSRVNSRIIAHAKMQRWIWNLQLATDSTFE